MAHKLFVNGFIGEIYDFWTDEIKSCSYNGVKANLEGHENEALELHVNSKGGDAFEGMAMLNLLKNHEGEKVAIVDGICASAATLPLFAMDKVLAHETTMFLYHQSATMAFGHAEDLEKSANELRKIDDVITDLYMTRFTGTEDELKALLNEDKLITAKEALEFGLIDEIVSNEKEQEKESVKEPDEPEAKATLAQVADESAKLSSEQNERISILAKVFKEYEA